MNRLYETLSSDSAAVLFRDAWDIPGSGNRNLVLLQMCFPGGGNPTYDNQDSSISELFEKALEQNPSRGKKQDNGSQYYFV